MCVLEMPMGDQPVEDDITDVRPGWSKLRPTPVTFQKLFQDKKEVMSSGESTGSSFTTPSFNGSRKKRSPKAGCKITWPWETSSVRK